MTQEIVDAIGTAVMLAIMLAIASLLTKLWNKYRERNPKRPPSRRLTRTEMVEGLQAILDNPESSASSKEAARDRLSKIRK